MTIADRVKKIIATHLSIDVANVVDQAGIIEDLGADSLDSIELIMSFEEEFGIEIPDDDCMTIITVGQAVAYLEKKVGGSV
jgi:acyl carrier protein